MTIGYRRCPPRSAPEAQTGALAAAGCERIFTDKASDKLASAPLGAASGSDIRALVREVLAGRRSVDTAVFAMTAVMIPAPDDNSDPYGAIPRSAR